ncbi:hypothetical protein Q1695_011143 [Nippostrongylus brasiliensis]|nr:hypothetical protein Q1695_011143 [Nippostrongylus brasiliensis]
MKNDVLHKEQVFSKALSLFHKWVEVGGRSLTVVKAIAELHHLDTARGDDLNDGVWDLHGPLLYQDDIVHLERRILFFDTDVHVDVYHIVSEQNHVCPTTDGQPAFSSIDGFCVVESARLLTQWVLFANRSRAGERRGGGDGGGDLHRPISPAVIVTCCS